MNISLHYPACVQQGHKTAPARSLTAISDPDQTVRTGRTRYWNLCISGFRCASVRSQRAASGKWHLGHWDFELWCPLWTRPSRPSLEIFQTFRLARRWPLEQAPRSESSWTVMFQSLGSDRREHYQTISTMEACGGSWRVSSCSRNSRLWLRNSEIQLRL